MSSWNRISALDALRSSDLLEIGMAANRKRHDLHVQPVVTYTLREHLSPHAARSASLSPEEDGNVFLTSLTDTEYIPLDALRSRLAACRTRFPRACFQQLPVSARHAYAQNLTALADALPALQEEGLESLQLELDASAPAAQQPDQLEALLASAAKNRLATTAMLTIGQGESSALRLDALECLRELQQQTGALLALLVAVHHSTAPDARREEDATAADYLTTLAVTRLYVDEISHLQTDWSVMGPKVLELALCFGADDAGLAPRSQAGNPGPSHHGGESELRRIIRDAGFRPVERDALFRQSLLH